MNKITVRIVGGIGNQLFSYSAARRLALNTGSELVIDDITGFRADKYGRKFELDHFNINCKKLSNSYFRSLILYYIKTIRIFNRYTGLLSSQIIKQVSDDFDKNILNHKIKNNLYIEGYWQSESYFKDVENIIRSDLKILKPKDFKNNELATKIMDSVSVAIHVRFFNSENVNDINNLPMSYYKDAINVMEGLIPNKLHYFIFSDKMDIALQHIPIDSDRVTPVIHNNSDDMAYADLWLMSLCDNFIIANSTFSWWGAWLSGARDKIVIAPKYRITGPENLTSWGFSGLIPNNWINI